MNPNAPSNVSNASRASHSGPPPGYKGPPPGHPEFARYMAEYYARQKPSGSQGPTHATPPAPPAEVRPVSGGYDGPSQRGASPTRSQASNVGRPTQGNDRTERVKQITNTRVELPAAAYGLDHEYSQTLMTRPGYSTTGKDVQVRVNQYKVTQWPNGDVYQYDVMIGLGAEKMGLIKAVWESPDVQNRLNAGGKGKWLWDGNKIAWCSKAMAELKFTVDMDVVRGKPSQPDRPDGSSNRFIVAIRPTKSIRLAVLSSYLNKKMTFDSSILEAINFMDHLMRQWPSEQYTMIKRSFFTRGPITTTLDDHISALKGCYSSIRLCSPSPSMGGVGTGLAINVDVANGTFWTCQDLHQAARNFTAIVAGNRSLLYPKMRDAMVGSVKDNHFSQSEAFKHLMRMTKLKFHVKHRGAGKMENQKEYTISGFTKSTQKDGVMHAKNSYFNLKATATRPAVNNISVYDYYKKQYEIDLQFWYLPLVETTRAGKFPMELCRLVPNQKYQYKLNPDQTANMIKFAVTRPKERITSVNHGVTMMNWANDPYLNNFGVKIEPNMTVTKAKVLPPPEVGYDKAKATPGYSGRWDLRGKKFFLPNPEPLKSWGVGVVGGCLQEAEVRNFLNVFIQTYVGHGGRVENKNPLIHIGNRNEDMGQLVVDTRKKVGDQAKMAPQILLFVMPGRDSWMYERLKKNNECRFAMVSQMLNIAHVRKAQPQYCSNVCMKLNAKLGGTSCKVVTAKPFFSKPTLIMGADVSHAGVGSLMPSVAALTMSMDTSAIRYAAAVQTNGFRVEMITETNINHMMMPLLKQWSMRLNNKQPPGHIYYFRDGVSEGQFDKVLNEEVAYMKKSIATLFPTADIKWTVIVCTKRHHIRIFPKDNDSQAGDRNGNALPGTLIERDVTHPFEYDFYLSSHSAIQGTARPVHYQVLLDEAKVPVNDLQKLIYQHCYQYMRSTTPVSLFPAVYYAHLASKRAACHDPTPSSKGPQGGQKFEDKRLEDANARAAASARGETLPSSSHSDDRQPTDAKPLLPLGNMDGGGSDAAIKIRTGMWYI